MLRSVALVKTDISEECIAFIISVTEIGEIGATTICSWRASVAIYC
jgi:hypothetical protein